MSKRGREYKAEVAELCRVAGVQEMSGDVSVSMQICPKKPKKDTGKKPRCLDVDNVAKGVLDALQGFAYANDAQIAALSITKGDPVPGGALHVRVVQL